ncbi:MarR family transcriptional regulator [Telmatospirillum sp.]|uniref:MarR family winged helix-turn-helix transcriptional regulator n=1 Tax=Telmatospirillum sp. TaxID=2079197 RepID=UPI00284BC331|nr:MarR family transcriptional regulator [Telmatospirillum sp.]MDR3436864.1 MarR family transcriptional regulator [Telmatospirillum sp.]
MKETRTTGGDVLQASNASALAIAALVEQLGRQVQNLCFTKELAPVQWSALRYFAKAGPSARTVSGLAAYTGVNASSASRTIQLLLGKGLVRIETDLGDCRIRVVTLSRAGVDLVERDPLRALATALNTLDDTERTSLRDLLEKLLFELFPKPFKEDGS